MDTKMRHGAEIREMLREMFEDWEENPELHSWFELDDEAEVAFYEGPLAKEEVHCPQYLVVKGNVDVAFEFSTAEQGSVLIMGNVTCGNAVLRGELNVTGSLMSRAYVYANSLNDADLTSKALSERSSLLRQVWLPMQTGSRLVCGAP